jgi:hypothetical protein
VSQFSGVDPKAKCTRKRIMKKMQVGNNLAYMLVLRSILVRKDR